MTSFLAASFVLGQQAYGQQVITQQGGGGGGAVGGPTGFASRNLRGTAVQTEVWNTVKESVAILPDAAGQPFGLAVMIDPVGYFVAHSSAIVSEPLTAVLEDGTQARLGRIGYDSTTQLVLLGAQNWKRSTRSAITVGDPDSPAKDMTMVTADGLVRSYMSRQNVPGVVQTNNRYIPLNEVQFERLSAPVGGALVFNRSGELMGILGATLTKAPGLPINQKTSTETLYGPQALTVGYALSPKVLRRVVKGFLTESHEVQHPNIGVLFKDNPIPSGAVVTQVKPESPAAMAGLRVGDVIRKFDNEDLTGGLDLATRLFDKDPGESIVLHFDREGRPMKVQITVGADQTALFL